MVCKVEMPIISGATGPLGTAVVAAAYSLESQCVLYPPLKFNYQAHWAFNSSLIQFGWRLGRCSNCHLVESLEGAGQKRLWGRSINCKHGGQDHHIMTRWPGLQHPALGDGPTWPTLLNELPLACHHYT